MAAGLRLVELRFLIERGAPAGDAARRALDECRRAGLREFETQVRILMLNCEPPEDVMAAYREFVRSGRVSERSPLLQLMLAVTVLQLLVERRRFQEARAVFGQARSVLHRIAAGITDETTRLRFLRRTSEPLQKAVAATEPEELPLYL